jgi:hypothetical protein
MVASSGSDTGNCQASPCLTLAYAFSQASSGDTISVGAGTFAAPNLNVPLSLAGLTIQGEGATETILDGESLGTVLYVYPDATATVNGVTVQHGYADEENGANECGGFKNYGTLTLTNDIVTRNGSDQEAGGVCNLGGILTMTDDTISSNSGGNPSQNGGGVLNTGTATLTNDTISNNGEGGIANYGGSITVTGSTLSANETGGFGGGLYTNAVANLTNDTFFGNQGMADGGGIYADKGARLTVTHVTLVGNVSVASDAGTGVGGGVFDNDASVGVTASIFAANYPGGDCAGDPVIDGGYNLDDDGTCGFTGTSISDVASPGVDSSGLGNNGGPTETIALEPGSPAIGYVTDSADCLPTDQRGYTETTPCDIGADDSEAIPPAETPEVSSLLLLPLSAIIIAGGVVARRRRNVDQIA